MCNRHVDCQAVTDILTVRLWMLYITATVLAHRIAVHADSTVCVAMGVKSLVVRISMHAVKLVAGHAVLLQHSGSVQKRT